MDCEKVRMEVLWGKDEMVISGLLHKGIPCGSVFSLVRLFLSFLVVFSISVSSLSGVHVREDFGIKR